MVFSSLLFVFAFLPLNLCFYYLAKSTPVQNAVMLVFSLVFYAWGEPKYVLLLVAMTFIDWLFSLAAEKGRGKKTAEIALVCACIADLGLLGVFKYGTFFQENLQALTGFPSVVTQIALPIGISFYTFQLLTYVVDVYRGDVKAEKNFFNVLLYAGLFHQCVAGPIVRYKDIAEMIRHRKIKGEDISAGIVRFTAGLGKKALLANACGAMADTMLLSDSTAADLSLLSENIRILSSRPATALWLGMLFFMLQIYLDFSAYSDMAIGMGMMTGFRYKENFDYPYCSTSITEFWRRWHISLGSFFRDYVYIPLGG
ncbi:MAG: MBOAT family protein, partial [Clostridia bacterium]|nr:MBOAT family protein [Clostridia bacterium]